jgi:hypothetical protein
VCGKQRSLAAVDCVHLDDLVAVVERHADRAGDSQIDAGALDPVNGD